MPPVFFSPQATVLDCGASRTALGVFSRKSGRLRLERYAVETLSTAAGNDDGWLENTAAAMLALRRKIKTAGPVKVPVLGSLPGLGRLFRSKGESTQKRNLLIFVTANLVSPGGSLKKQSMQGVTPGTLYKNPTIVTPAGSGPCGK
jgi:hypothetical protein